MDIVPLTPANLGVAGILSLAAAVLIQAGIFVLLVAIGAWLAIRFEKWRDQRIRPKE